MAPAQLEVLCTLLQSPSCPEVVLRLCAFDVWRLLSNKRVYTIPNAALKANIATSRAVAGRILGFKDDGNAVAPDPALSETDMSWLDYPTSSVRSALSDARVQKVPSINVTRCLASSQPTQFLHMLFSELSRAALGMGLVGVSETEAVRSLATFVLSFPRTWASSSPPLLPLFVHVVVPKLIATVDQQPPNEKSVNTELLASMLSSALTSALQVELALQTVRGLNSTDVPVLGQPIASMARRLATTLRSLSHSSTEKILGKNIIGSHPSQVTTAGASSAAAAILQRLTASSIFVTNFPTFMAQ